jgi:hypothetical protein
MRWKQHDCTEEWPDAHATLGDKQCGRRLQHHREPQVQQVVEPLQAAEEVVHPLTEAELVPWIAVPGEEVPQVPLEDLDATEAPPEPLALQ